MVGVVAEGPATAPSSPGKQPCLVGLHAGARPRPRGWACRRGPTHGREWVHTCASQDIPSTHRQQLIMIIYNYQTLRAKALYSIYSLPQLCKINALKQQQCGDLLESGIAKKRLYLQMMSLIKPIMFLGRGCT